MVGGRLEVTGVGGSGTEAVELQIIWSRRNTSPMASATPISSTSQLPARLRGSFLRNMS